MISVLAQDLRNAVLQAAMEGKLTKQNDTDKSAFELIESIMDERKKLADEKKIKIIKQYSSDLYNELNIPENWARAHLGDISTYQESSKKISYSKAREDSWSLDLEDIEKGGKIIEKKRVRDRSSNGDKTVFYKGDILYSKLRPYLLKILIADEDGICTSELIPFKMYGGINTAFIVYYLKSPLVDAYINSVTYGVKMPRVNTDTMENLMVPIPPIEEQGRIVCYLDELMTKIDELEIIQNKLKTLY